MRHFPAFMAAVFMAAMFLTPSADAQLRVNLNFNVGSQPIWGPAGYDYAEYYYMPDIEVYYSVPRHRFIYYDGGRWRNSVALPSRYRGFDLYNSHKIVLNERTPYLRHGSYKGKYSSYQGRQGQQPIRDSREPKYYVNKNHPEHQTWVQNQRGNGNNGRGNGNGNSGRGNGNGNGNNGRGNSGKRGK